MVKVTMTVDGAQVHTAERDWFLTPDAINALTGYAQPINGYSDMGGRVRVHI